VRIGDSRRSGNSCDPGSNTFAARAVVSGLLIRSVAGAADQLGVAAFTRRWPSRGSAKGVTTAVIDDANAFITGGRGNEHSLARRGRRHLRSSRARTVCPKR
jgi:hypothetical protein